MPKFEGLCNSHGSVVCGVAQNRLERVVVMLFHLATYEYLGIMYVAVCFLYRSGF